MSEEKKVTKTTEQKIEENKKILVSLRKKKENLENNILQIEKCVCGLKICLTRFGHGFVKKHSCPCRVTASIGGCNVLHHGSLLSMQYYGG